MFFFLKSYIVFLSGDDFCQLYVKFPEAATTLPRIKGFGGKHHVCPRSSAPIAAFPGMEEECRWEGVTAVGSIVAFFKTTWPLPLCF